MQERKPDGYKSSNSSSLQYYKTKSSIAKRPHEIITEKKIDLISYIFIFLEYISKFIFGFKFS
jgi:hypothetical protein